MLIELSIKNLAVIESIQVICSKGFHVITGETGAGKSMIIDALTLIAGGRGSSDVVRHGCEKAEIEAMFELQSDHPVWEALLAIGIPAARDEYLIIRREISLLGKSSNRINGQLVNLSMLREIGDWLINIHGQHEHQSLLKIDQHLKWLDAYGGEMIIRTKEEYQQLFHRCNQILKLKHELEDKSKKSLQMEDLYRFQITEITKASLKAGEDEWLQDEKRKLANAEKLERHVSEAYEALSGSSKGLEWISRAMIQLQDIVTVDPDLLGAISEQIQTAYYQLEDASFQLRDYRENVEFNPERIDYIEERLDLLASFRRKYGEKVEDILLYLEKITKELDIIDHSDQRLMELNKEWSHTFSLLSNKSKELTLLRIQATERLAHNIETELGELQMSRTRFETQVRFRSDGSLWNEIYYGKDGQDAVEFMIAANPGEPLRSLHKTASGGEMSRIMLAMKSIFASIDQIPVLVFDEVDTGVSGRAAQAIADKLSSLSKNCQVFSITHLPQVASMADVHFSITKEIVSDRTYAKVEKLSEHSRIHELSRMLSGVEITDTTERHALEMLNLAAEKKRQ